MVYDPYNPLPHQDEDSNAMLEFHNALLWADPGTGKTLTAMEAALRGGYKKLVVLCPPIAISMWVEELRKHMAPGYYAYARRLGMPPPKKHAAMNADAFITTYSLAEKHSRFIKDFISGRPNEGIERPKSALIMDEAHFIKNREAKRTKAILGPFSTGGDGTLAGEFTDVWQLTGTPITRYSDDLWTQLMCACPEIMAAHGAETYQKFLDKFCRVKYVQYTPRSPRRLVVAGNKNMDALQKLLADAGAIRRRLEDVVENLPAITHRVIDIPVTKVETVNALSPKEVKHLDNPNSGLSKVYRLLGMAKAEGVAKYVSEFGRRPVLVGYWHTTVREAIREELEKLNPNWVIEVVSGQTPPDKREEIRERFNAGEIDVLLGQMLAMSVSWNLQEACNHIIIAETIASPGVLDQFIARVYRRGQTGHVQVDYAVSNHGIDEALEYVRKTKASDTDRLI